MNSSVGKNRLPKGYTTKVNQGDEAYNMRMRPHESTLSNNYSINKLGSDYENFYIKSKDTYFRARAKDFSNGLPQGRGSALYPDGTYYIGNFNEGEAEDERGILIFPNGAVYEGRVERSKLQGQGTLKHRLDYIYQGQWHNNKPHGWGRQTFKDGFEDCTYDGYFVDGQKQCFDNTRDIKSKLSNPPTTISTYRRGKQIYKGEFLKGVMHGYGTLYHDDIRRHNSDKRYANQENKLTDADDSYIYRGQFVDGKKQGYGSLVTEHGTLTGEFHNDVITGEGIFEWHDKRKYEGTFRNSLFDGQGKIYFPKDSNANPIEYGHSIKGLWREGQGEKLQAVFGSQLQEGLHEVGQMFSSRHQFQQQQQLQPQT